MRKHIILWNRLCIYVSLSLQSSQFSKLEKADILEMTVKHLRQLQRQQIHAAVNGDPTVVTKFRSGFSQCANEVLRYLDTTHGVDGTVKSRLAGHLSGCVNSVQGRELQVAAQQQQVQPLQLQIPLAPQASIRHDGMMLPTHLSPNTSPQEHSIKDSSQVSTQMVGTFKLVPSNVCNGAVAVYLGHTCNDNQPDISVPVYSIQVPQEKVPLSEYAQQQPIEHNHINVRTFDNVAANQKPVYKAMSPVCVGHSAAEAFKQEHVWRPW